MWVHFRVGSVQIFHFISKFWPVRSRFMMFIRFVRQMSSKTTCRYTVVYILYSYQLYTELNRGNKMHPGPNFGPGYILFPRFHYSSPHLLHSTTAMSMSDTQILFMCYSDRIQCTPMIRNCCHLSVLIPVSAVFLHVPCTVVMVLTSKNSVMFQTYTFPQVEHANSESELLLQCCDNIARHWVL